MWFEHAIGKEKIKFMFNNELSLHDIEFSKASIERYSDLLCYFYLKKLPKKYPEKWEKESFNAILLVVSFGDLIKLEINGSRVGFFCSPEIKSFPEFSEIKIESDDFNLYCKSKFLTIKDIIPYTDERWD